MPEQYRPYVIVSRTEETPGVSTFLLQPAAGERPSFVAGQFVNIALPGHTEAKSYTIASPPQDDKLAVTIRAAGIFSTALLTYQVGNKLSLSEPMGYFCVADAAAPRLWLAGGIGITPFMSMVREKPLVSPTLLYYSNRTVEDIAFCAELEAAVGPAFSLRHFITRDQAAAGMTAGRIAEADLAEALQQLQGCHVYICGSIGFVRDYWSILRRLKIPEDRLFTEAFF